LIDDKFATLEKMIDLKLTTMQYMIDKNLAQYQATANEMKGDIKTLSVRLDMLTGKIGWYITLLGVAVTVIVAVVQAIVK